MKVNANVEISDEQRNVLARIIDGKNIKRLATRDEVRAFLAGCIESLKESGETVDSEPAVAVQPPRPLSYSELLRIDPEDEAVLKDKEPGFIIGWNKVKRRRAK